MKNKGFFLLACSLFIFTPINSVFAAGADTAHGYVATLIWIGLILMASKISSLVERFKQPAVMGELLVGVILGNLFLAGIYIFEPIKSDPFIPFLAEIGVIILLFQVGLESNISHMRKVGNRALAVAIIGVAAPFILGVYVAGPWLFPDQSPNTHLFLGAALTATSVGITARVFKDLGKLKMKEAQIVLGAAVIDDIMGLMILAVVSALVTIGSITLGLVSTIVGKALLFLIGSIVLGQFVAPHIGRLLSKIHTGTGMKLTLAVSLALVFSYVAGTIGLAPIIGAFAAGLVLDPVHFRFFNSPMMSRDINAVSSELDETTKKKLDTILDHYNHKHVEDLIEPLAHFFVPIFFVYTGISVELETLFDPKIFGTALVITAVAIIGKFVSGFAAGDVNKSIVGFGMVPRGEVGLIFATIGRSLGVVDDRVFSVIVIMVIFTTLFTPPILTFLLNRRQAATV